jgi:hypothetical protein
MVRHLRIISGGKQTGSAPSKPSGLRLYRAHSVGDLTRADVVYHDVKFNWYCLERKHPPGHYKELIAGFDNLELKQRVLLESDIDCSLTAEEVVALRAYLEARYGLELHTTELALPIKGRSLLFMDGATIVYDFLELSEQDRYPLPFKIWGYYTTLHCLSSPGLENGVRFLRKALELLGFDANLRAQQLEAVVKALYASDRLWVLSAKTSK